MTWLDQAVEVPQTTTTPAQSPSWLDHAVDVTPSAPSWMDHAVDVTPQPEWMKHAVDVTPAAAEESGIVAKLAKATAPVAGFQIAREELGRDLGSFSPKAYETITGRKWLTQPQIDALPTEEARAEADRNQSSAIINFGKDLYNLKNIPGAAAMAVHGYTDAVKRGAAQGLADTNDSDSSLTALAKIVGESQLESAKTGLSAGGTMVKESAKSLLGFLADPAHQIENEPMQALANAATVTGVGGALKAPTLAGKLAGVARELSPIPLGRAPEAVAASDALRPTTVAKQALEAAVPHLPDKAVETAQYLLDARAGVSNDAQKVLTDFRRNKAGRTAEALATQEQALQGLDEAQRGDLRDFLAGEQSRVIMPDLPERVSNLKYRVQSVIDKGQLTVDQARYLADHDPQSLDQAIQAFQHGTMGPTEAVTHALAHNDVSVVNKATGDDLGSVGYMLFGEHVNPADIEIHVNPLSPFAGQAIHVKQQMESLRKMFGEFANDATTIDVGAGKTLLAKDLVSKRLAHYVPDVYAGEKDPALRAMFRDLAGQGGAFLGSQIKNRMIFADRVGLGAVADLEKSLPVAITSTVNELEKYRLFDRVSKLANGEVLQPAEFAALDAQAKAGYRLFPTQKLEGSDLNKYGALAGMAVKKPVWNMMRNIDTSLDDMNRLQKIITRTRSAWGSSKVVLNLPSWFNNTVGNLLHNVVNDGVAGSGNYAAQMAQAIRRGLPNGKADEWYAAARKAGLVGGKQIWSTGDEGVKVAAAVQKFGLVKGVGNKVKSLLEDGIPEAALNGYELAIRDNRVMQKVHDIFGGLDEASKVSVFKSAIENQARTLGVAPKSLLTNVDALNQAADVVDRFHFSYDTVPIGLQLADRYGALPFTRYAWKSIGAAVDMAAQNPALYRTSEIGSRKLYDASPQKDQVRMDYQPGFRGGLGVPISDTLDLNTRYMSPYSSPQDILGAGRSGGQGPEQFKTGMAKWEPSGIGGDLLKIAKGNSPLTDKPFDPLAPWFGGVNVPGLARSQAPESASGALVNEFLPGEFYHFTQKVLPAIQGVSDRRGREVKPAQAIPGAMGVRLEDSNPGKANAGYVEGFIKYRDQLTKQLEDDLQNAKTPQERDRLVKAYQESVASAQDLLREYRQPRRK